jgi:hypothetical protein
MFQAIDVKAIKKYVSPNDPDKNNPTVFHHGIIEPVLRAHIEGKCFNSEINDKNKDGKRIVNINVTKHSILIVKYGLRGIENFNDAAGHPVRFELGNHNINGVNYPALPDDIIAALGTDLINELAEQIIGNQEVSEEQEKN